MAQRFSEEVKLNMGDSANSGENYGIPSTGKVKTTFATYFDLRTIIQALLLIGSLLTAWTSLNSRIDSQAVTVADLQRRVQLIEAQMVPRQEHDLQQRNLDQHLQQIDGHLSAIDDKLYDLVKR